MFNSYELEQSSQSKNHTHICKERISIPSKTSSRQKHNARTTQCTRAQKCHKPARMQCVRHISSGVVKEAQLVVRLEREVKAARWTYIDIRTERNIVLDMYHLR